MRLPPFARLLVAAALAAPLVMTSADARAQTEDLPKPPPPLPKARWHPDYVVESSFHFLVSYFDKYQAGLGFGARFAVPTFDHFPFKSFDNTFGFGVGFDGVRYAGYRPRDPLDPVVTTYALYVPVYAQWNIWVGGRVSFFLEPTLLYRFATYAGNGCGEVAGTGKDCAPKSRVLPTGYAGLRFRIGDHVAGIFRVGWPMVTLGIDWL